MAKRSYTKRAPYHDYHKPAIYFLTLAKDPDCPSFGRVTGNVEREYGEPDFPRTVFSQYGRIIASHLRDFERMHNGLQKRQYVVMPDHLHVLLHVNETLPEVLDKYVERFESEVDAELIKKGLLMPGKRAFSEGFNDQLLKKGQLLNDLYFYIRNNPKRLLEKLKRPDFFEKSDDSLLGWKIMRYGNNGLLENPWKECVIVHRADSEEIVKRKEEYWVDFSLRGGVLVGAFIHPLEKQIMRKALEGGGRVIHLSTRLLAEKEKPKRELINACFEGQMLVIIPYATGSFEERRISRETCMALNHFAKRLCEVPLSQLRR